MKQEELEKLEELRKTIEASPLTQQIRANQATETLRKRQVAAQAIEALQKEQVKNLPELQADLKAKEAVYRKTKANMEIVLNELRTAQAALFRKNSDFHSAIGTHEEILLSTYEPEIDLTLEFFRAKLDFLRSPGRINRVGRKSVKNLLNWTKKTLSESNVPAIKAAMEYCRNAITELEKMKLLPELNLLKIQGLKDGLPSIEIYTESQGTKPMERQAPTIIEPCEFSFKKLLEKVDKFLVTPTKKAR